MQVVTEVISGRPFDRPERIIQRDEARLFEIPGPNVMRFLTADLPPLAVYSFPTRYEPVEFAPPRGVFEGSALRVEWQTMSRNGRQPFYHRNADVDEIGYQVVGGRTLMTECGTVEFEVGQFSRIPVGVAHDNYGRDDIHLLFYMHGPAKPGVAPVGFGTHRVPPFAGWQAKPMVEALTNCLGGPHCDLAYCMVDEELLLGAAAVASDLLEVLQPAGPAGTTEWLYRAPKVWIGHTCLEHTRERRYERNLCADEIQYQVEGSRTIVSQRGVVTLNAGDFTCIPVGCAYANVTEDASKHISVLTCETTPPVREPNRLADTDVGAWLADHAGGDAVSEG